MKALGVIEFRKYIYAVSTIIYTEQLLENG